MIFAQSVTICHGFIEPGDWYLFYIQKSEYIGWRYVKEGKHDESAYFAYFNREFGVKTILAMRKMKNGGPFKPYAIIDQYAFEINVGELQKGTPL